MMAASAVPAGRDAYLLAKGYNDALERAESWVGDIVSPKQASALLFDGTQLTSVRVLRTSRRPSAAVHEEVVARDKAVFGLYQQSGNVRDLVGCTEEARSRNLDHALVPWTAWTRELILGQRREDDPPADRVDAGAALALADCLSHDAQRIAALRYLVGAQRVLDLVRLQHG